MIIVLQYTTRETGQKNASPSRESLENRGTDISRSTNLPREIYETFLALLMLLGAEA